MHVFVTGGTGHAGSYVIPELIAAGHEVTGLAPTEEDPALPVGPMDAGTLRARNAVEIAVVGLAERGVRSSVVRIPPIAHSATDRVGFLLQLIGLAKEMGFVGYPGDGENRWTAVH